MPAGGDEVTGVLCPYERCVWSDDGVACIGEKKAEVAKLAAAECRWYRVGVGLKLDQ